VIVANHKISRSIFDKIEFCSFRSIDNILYEDYLQYHYVRVLSISFFTAVDDSLFSHLTTLNVEAYYGTQVQKFHVEFEANNFSHIGD